MKIEFKILEEELICRICGETKNIDKFYISIRNKSGRRGECAVCSRLIGADQKKRIREQGHPMKKCRNCGEEYKPKSYREYCYKEECSRAYRKFLADRNIKLKIEYKYEKTGRECAICGEEILTIYKRTSRPSMSLNVNDFWVCIFSARFHCDKCKEVYFKRADLLGDDLEGMLSFA